MTAVPSATWAPFGRSTGHFAIRGTPVGTGDSHRSSSSTASGMIDGSSTIIWRCSGWVARNAYEQVSVSLTVSSPAMRNRKQMSRISSFVSRSPSISALTKRVMMSSAGARGAFVDEVAEVLVDLRTGRVHHRHARVAVDERVLVRLLRMQDPVTHAQEHAHLVLGQTHQAEEHRRREQLGELLAEVALATIDERIDEAVHATGDVFLLLVHALAARTAGRGASGTSSASGGRRSAGSSAGRCRGSCRMTDENSSWWRSTYSVVAREKLSAIPGIGSTKPPWAIRSR